MSNREIKLWGIVGLVIVAGLIFKLIGPILRHSDPNGASVVNQNEAVRLLRSEANISARNKAATARYNLLAKRFFAGEPAQAELEFLATVEDIALECGLKIQSKHTLSFSAKEIGVELEGDSDSPPLFSFMQRLTETSGICRIKRLQIHAVPDKRMLKYQLILSALLLK
jgi:hypothetical protein